MRARKKTRRLEQLHLFHPPRRLPAWEDLPAVSRQTVTRLLAHILQEHHKRVDSQDEEGDQSHG